MKKEVLLAVIFGLLLGVGVVYGFYLSSNSQKQPAASNQTPPVTTQEQENNNQLFTIDQPEDGSIFKTNLATLSGTIQPGVTLSLITEDDALFIKPTDGAWSQQVKLTLGGNTLQLVGLTASGQQETIFLNLAYLNEE